MTGDKTISVVEAEGYTQTAPIMPLTLRRVARTGPHDPEDWLVMDGKHAVGRIRNSPANLSVHKWEWFVNPSLPIPPACRSSPPMAVLVL